MSVKTLAANMRHAAQNYKPAIIGGGLFTPAELREGAGLIEAAEVLRNALQTAEDFIEGFEGDDMQEGIDDLLRFIRTTLAIAGRMK